MKNFLGLINFIPPKNNHYIESKMKLTIRMSLLVLGYSIVADLLRLSNDQYQLSGYFFLLTVCIEFLMIKYGFLEMAQFLLLSVGIIISFRSFTYNETFHFYTQMIMILFISAIIHARKYQMWIVSLLVNGLVLSRSIYLFSLELAEPLTRNIFEQSVFVTVGIFSLTLMINQFLKIIDDEVNETLLLKGIVDQDVMTGLNNRANYNKEMQQISEADTIIHLAILDIDDFKLVNDDFGHDVGDYVLISLSNLMKQWFVEECFQIFRWGGEEFAIIADDIKVEDFIDKLEHFRVNFMKTEYYFKRSVTLSVGVTTRLPGEKQEITFIRADQALYDAKHSGKNKLKYSEALSGEII